MTPTVQTTTTSGNRVSRIQGVSLADVVYLDRQLLGPDRIPRMMPAHIVQSIDPIHLRVWLHARAIYVFPTTELVAFIRRWVDIVAKPATTIEIAAGCSGLGYHVGVRQTDSFVQVDNPAVAAYYAATDQPPVRPSVGVMKLDAATAVKKLRPRAVFGSYVTQRAPDKKGNGNPLGPNEVQMLARVKHYLHVGSDTVHDAKHINDYPHETHRPDWIISRAGADSHIRIWGENAL